LTLGPIHHNAVDNFDAPDDSFGMVVYSQGNMIVVGRIGVARPTTDTLDTDWHVRKYDPSGALLWSDTYDGNQLVDVAFKIGLLSNDDVVVVGYTNKGTDNTADGADYDWRVIKYDPSGNQEDWSAGLHNGIGFSEACYDIAVDEYDHCYIGGSMANDGEGTSGVIHTLDGVTGERQDGTIVLPQTSLVYGLAYRNSRLAVASNHDNGVDLDFYVALVAVSDVADPCENACMDDVLDTDHDGVTDCEECYYGTDELDNDTDGDGMPDGFEVEHGLDPLTHDADADHDLDGLSNLEEYLHRSDPDDAGDPYGVYYVDATGGLDMAGYGSYGQPFATIDFALTQIAASLPTASTPIRLNLMSGTYVESFSLMPWLTVAGLPGEVVVIEGELQGAADSVLENVELRAVVGTGVLLTVDDIAMSVMDVTFTGTASRMAVGISMLDFTGGTLIDGCSFNLLKTGIEIDGQVPLIRRSVFNHASLAGIHLKSVKKDSRKAVGTIGDPTSGWNTFAVDISNTELAVLNDSGQALNMDYNDWGVATVEEAQALVSGDVVIDSVLPPGTGILAGSIYCTVQASDTQLPVLSATVTLSLKGTGSAHIVVVSENVDGLYPFPVVDAGDYAVEISAVDYGTWTGTVTVGINENKSILTSLDADTGNPPGACAAAVPGSSSGYGFGDAVMILALIGILWFGAKRTGHDGKGHVEHP
jgi:hypothetical protein